MNTIFKFKMIVCLCKVSRSRDIAKAIVAGAQSVDEVGEACGAGTGCGACRVYIHDMLDNAGVGCSGGCSDCQGQSLSLAS